jgi:hypothetical protein
MFANTTRYPLISCDAAVSPRETAPAATDASLSFDLIIWTYAPGEAWPDVAQVLADDAVAIAEHVEEQFQAPETGLQLYTCKLLLDVPRPVASRTLPRLDRQLADLRSRVSCDVLLQEHRPR